MPGAEPDPPLLSNAELATIFHAIGDMLEVKGELVFKTVAYHRAADAIAHEPVELARSYREGNPPRIAGVGQAISDNIAELSRTGRLAFYDRLAAEVPEGLLGLLQVPGVGPRTARILHESLGDRQPRRASRGGSGGSTPDGQGPIREDRGVDPGRDRVA